MRRIFEIQASFMALYRVGIIPKNVLSGGGGLLAVVMQWGRDLTPKALCEFYCAYPHLGLTALLADLKMEEVFMDAEMEKRIKIRPVASKFILLDWEKEDKKREVEKLLQVDSVRSRRPWEQEDSDIKAEALTKALELWKTPGTELPGEDSSTLPAFPLEPYASMFPAEREFWEGPMARMWRIGKASIMSDVVPIFAGERESIPAKVRDHVREEWRKLRRRRDIYESHQEQIKTEIHPEMAEKLNLRPDISARMLEVLRSAKKRWGAKAVKALQYSFEGKTEEEAAKLAGITARTLRNYKLKLNKDFSRKK